MKQVVLKALGASKPPKFAIGVRFFNGLLMYDMNKEESRIWLEEIKESANKFCERFNGQLFKFVNENYFCINLAMCECGPEGYTFVDIGGSQSVPMTEPSWKWVNDKVEEAKVMIADKLSNLGIKKGDDLYIRQNVMTFHDVCVIKLNRLGWYFWMGVGTKHAS